MENNKNVEYKRLDKIHKQRKKKRKNTFLRRLQTYDEKTYRFVKSDMWCLYDAEMSGVPGFASLRQWDGISGFTHTVESLYDSFIYRYASNSISAAIDKLREKGYNSQYTSTLDSLNP